VAVAVPGQGGHPGAESELQPVQGIGHLARTPGDILVGVAVQVALDAARNDLAFAMVAFGEFDQ